MITVDFFLGGGRFVFHKTSHHHHRRHGRATRENGSAFRRRRLVASTRRARCFWNGASSSSRLKFTRIRSSLFFISISHPLEFVNVFIGSKPTSLCDRRRLLREARLSRCRVAHHSLSLFSFHLTSLSYCARTRTGTDDQRRHDDGERRDQNGLQKPSLAVQIRKLANGNADVSQSGFLRRGEI